MKLIKRWRNNREIYLFTETLKEVNSFLKVVRIYFFFILFSIFFFIDNQNHLDNLYYAVYCWTSWNSLLEPFIMVTYSLFCRSGILKYRSPMVFLTSLLSVVNPYMYIKQMSMPPMHKVENEISCDNWRERTPALEQGRPHYTRRWLKAEQMISAAGTQHWDSSLGKLWCHNLHFACKIFV